MAQIPQKTLPIVLAIITVGLSIAMLVGWPIIIVSSDEIYSTWLLVLGIISLSIILLALMALIFFVARERRASRRQFGFIDSVTHELKSPLASMKLCLETLKRPDLPADKGEGLIDMMLDDVDRLSAFIGDVLQANRMLHGVALNRERIVLTELGAVLAARIARRHRIDPSQIRFEVSENIAVWTDRLALETVLSNLLDNAVKYSDRPAEVTVTVARPNSRRIRIDVTDRGIGLAREEQARIFDRFYRVDAEAVRQRRGTGLGLFVVRALVRSMRGRVRAISPGPGLGTTVSVILPSRQPPAPGAPA
ncbi:MAG: signal transduction histidine kinase [Bradymonadia bacterium]|jgi:signal transduction histidine kinase